MTRVKLVDKSAPYYAARRFTMQGKEYQQDEQVSFEGLNEREVSNLILSTYITDRAPADVGTVVPVIITPTPPKPPTQEIEDSTPVNLGELVHVGGGQYEVHNAEGVNMLPEKVKGKDMAKMAAEQFGIRIAK